MTERGLHRLRFILFIFLVLVLVAPAQGEEAGKLSIGDVRAPPSLAGAHNGTAYFTLRNNGAAADRLIAIDTPVADRAELHQHKMEDGVMRMRPLSELTVEPGQSVRLAPGGLHVMLMGLRHPLEVGDTFPLTLIFAQAGRVSVTATVAAGRE